MEKVVKGRLNRECNVLIDIRRNNEIAAMKPLFARVSHV